ncbi:hypothetical protein [Nostoc sp. DSM 114167]|jgi:hypothetical protein|uniref:hypothetical protein n=1 Tax=Nostoc sp. DSM 114167 TaxID=3439050 RepID=UPI004045576B
MQAIGRLTWSSKSKSSSDSSARTKDALQLGQPKSVVADDIEFSTREMGQSAALTGYLDIASDRP